MNENICRHLFSYCAKTQILQAFTIASTTKRNKVSLVVPFSPYLSLQRQILFIFYLPGRRKIAETPGPHFYFTSIIARSSHFFLLHLAVAEVTEGIQHLPYGTHPEPPEAVPFVSLNHLDSQLGRED